MSGKIVKFLFCPGALRFVKPIEQERVILRKLKELKTIQDFKGIYKDIDMLQAKD